MEVLNLNKRFLKTFGTCLNEEKVTLKESIISKYVNWTMLWISICTIGVSIQYIVSHFNDTESILFAVMQVSANTASGGGYWTFYRKKFEVSKFLDQIQSLFEMSEYHKFIIFKGYIYLSIE